MKNKQYIILGFGVLGLLGFGYWSWSSVKPLSGMKSQHEADDALLALIKNDQEAFQRFVEGEGNLQANLPILDGKIYTVAEGMAYFERVGFINYLKSKKLKFIQQDQSKDYDVLSIAITKNNPELLKSLLTEKPNAQRTYGKNQWTLLHLASHLCSHKVIEILDKQTDLKWNTKAKDGSTPLTLAAESECLPMLSYWKGQKVDFKKKDGRGLSALAILKEKKGAALAAFAQSFVTPMETQRSPASVVRAEVNFYKKRAIPKEKLIDHSAIIEPEVRPMEAVETAEFSEFSD